MEIANVFEHVSKEKFRSAEDHDCGLSVIVVVNLHRWSHLNRSSTKVLRTIRCLSVGGA